jgi:hypothetical protein
VNVSSTLNEGVSEATVTFNVSTRGSVAATLGPRAWPIRLQQSSGVLSPAQRYFVFLQQAIVRADDCKSPKVLAAADVATNNTIPVRNIRAKTLTPQFCSSLGVDARVSVQIGQYRQPQMWLHLQADHDLWHALQTTKTDAIKAVW